MNISELPVVCAVLNIHHSAEVRTLVLSRTTFVGIPREEGSWVSGVQQATLLELDNLLSQPASVAMVFGAYQGDRLVGSIITFQSPNQACWLLRTAYVAPSSRHDVIAALLDYATITYEGLGFKRFLAMYTEDSYLRYTRLNHRTSVMDRYVGTTEFLIEPNKRPKFLDYWEYLYGRMLFPVRTVIRSFNLVDDSMSTFHPIREAK
jgi:hypothetical protein